MAAVAITEQVADSTAGPVVVLAEQHADAAPVVSVAVVLTEQHVDSGGGSLAGMRLVAQSATAPSRTYTPASFGAASGSQQWTPYQTRVSGGTGAWK